MFPLQAETWLRRKEKIVHNPNTAANAAFVMAPFFILVGIILYLFIHIWCNIFQKAGYNRFMGLLMLIPGINFLMLLVLAFDKWPIERKLESVKQ